MDIADIASSLTFQASHRLASGSTVQITVVDGEVRMNCHNDDGVLVAARMNRQETHDVELSLWRASSAARRG